MLLVKTRSQAGLFVQLNDTFDSIWRAVDANVIAFHRDGGLVMFDRLLYR